MKYKTIDLSRIAMYNVSEDCAKAVIDWRQKKGINQRIFDNALKQAVECGMYGMTPDEALDRWMESGWTGMKWVLVEAKKCHAEKPNSVRNSSVLENLTDRSWANE